MFAEIQCTSDGGTLFESFWVPVSSLDSAAAEDLATKGVGAALDKIEWDYTAARLYVTAAQTANGLSTECWDNALYRIVNSTCDNPTKLPGSNATAASYFSEAGNEDLYAIATIPGNRVWWSIGQAGDFGRQANWLQGAVLHELLHNMGFDDGQLFDALSPVDRSAANRISIRLAELCFK